MIVVLPTPGPPVMIENFERSERSSASRCADASVKPALPCHQPIARSASNSAKERGADMTARTREATARSPACSPRR